MVDDKQWSTRENNTGRENEMSQESKKEMYTTWGEMIRYWPKTTLCIVSNEFCERFSYYGMRTHRTGLFVGISQSCDCNEICLDEQSFAFIVTRCAMLDVMSRK
ncbi:hypothetical protein KIN20_009583 [Parelaphostrongylus tenuis]|uniref:Uncharacterized protein n=1 Tax=Parelaphostrongylus tenuis TaxID=148309 RepID=A0AAD5QIC1_PARTN|nr:hypothetical protein KIN20_009583 [Parelaphostrongylus tenuis]